MAVVVDDLRGTPLPDRLLEMIQVTGANQQEVDNLYQQETGEHGSSRFDDRADVQQRQHAMQRDKSDTAVDDRDSDRHEKQQGDLRAHNSGKLFFSQANLGNRAVLAFVRLQIGVQAEVEKTAGGDEEEDAEKQPDEQHRVGHLLRLVVGERSGRKLVRITRTYDFVQLVRYLFPLLEKRAHRVEKKKEGKHIDNVFGDSHAFRCRPVNLPAFDVRVVDKHGVHEKDHHGKHAAEEIRCIGSFVADDIVTRELSKGHGHHPP